MPLKKLIVHAGSKLCIIFIFEYILRADVCV